MSKLPPLPREITKAITDWMFDVKPAVERREMLMKAFAGKQKRFKHRRGKR